MTALAVSEFNRTAHRGSQVRVSVCWVWDWHGACVMPGMKFFQPLAILLWLFAVTFAAGGASAEPQTLRIGLADDPDMLDPTLARTYTGRIVFAALCDKLVD